MKVVRRVYILLVCAISLQAVTWAIIALLRNLLVTGLNALQSNIALQTAVILVGFPIFLVHWLWAQRLAAQDDEERSAALRRLYLFGVMAAFLAPAINSTYNLFYAVLQQLLGVSWRASTLDSLPVTSLGGNLAYFGLSLLVLALFGAYQWYTLRVDRRQQPQTTLPMGVQRIYVLLFTTVGLVLCLTALIPLLRWLLQQIPWGTAVPAYPTFFLVSNLARLLVGGALWLTFWLWAQRLFASGHAAERESVLRKFYLYTAVFTGTVGVVSTVASVLAGLLSRWLGAPLEGDIRNSLAILVVMGIVWGYHAHILTQDTRQVAEQPQQAVLRRLYHYLVAGVGLLALLVGLGGLIAVLLFVLDGEPFVGGVRQALAWFVATILAGLLVWLLPWRRLQVATANEQVRGQAERQSLVRKIYLYLFVFLATMTALGTAVFIVSQLVELLLGSRAPVHLLRDLGVALSYSILAMAIWLYHGAILRSDGRLAERERRAALAAMRVAVFTGSQPALMSRLSQSLQHALPETQVQTVIGMAEGQTAVDAGNTLAQANVIITPVTLLPPNGENELATAVANSPAHKLLIPVPQPGCLWLELEKEDEVGLAQQAAQAMIHIATGEGARAGRKWGVGTILGLIVGGFVLLSLLLALVQIIIEGVF